MDQLEAPTMLSSTCDLCLWPLAVLRQVEILLEVRPQPSRQGLKNYRWPKEYLATIYAIFEFSDGNNNARSELVKEYLPDLEMDYAMTTG